MVHVRYISLHCDPRPWLKAKFPMPEELPCNDHYLTKKSTDSSLDDGTSVEHDSSEDETGSKPLALAERSILL